MENPLLNYMNKRLGQQDLLKARGEQTAGPVITISRDVGCGGLKTAKKIAASLNETLMCKKWQVISKEVLAESARELELDPQKVTRLFATNERFTFDEILAAFSDKKYKSDRLIRKSVREVIRTFAIGGCCIIVGRAAHILASDIDRSLHIRLTAPLEWRIQKIAANKKLSEEEARLFIANLEKERSHFRRQFIKEKSSPEEFDLTINVSKFGNSQLIQLVRSALDLKGVILSYKSKVSLY